jgi:hypothetical protein
VQDVAAVLRNVVNNFLLTRVHLSSQRLCPSGASGTVGCS